VERLLARAESCPLRGHLLRVVTIFVAEGAGDPVRVLRFGVAADALGADPPHLIEHELRLEPDHRIVLDPSPGEATWVVEGRDSPPSFRPLPALLNVALNAILYATSPGVEPEVRRTPRPKPRTQDEGAVSSSDEVYFLPGHIEISQLRQMQELERVPSGRKLLHRFMVRGHWRRPAKSWKDQHPRWVRPYWKGPDIAAVIERTYRLKP
jgi:hypothetical protein